MRWDYGKIYKEIRKSKGLTQEEICGDFLARSTLARIESGQVVPKFYTMIFLLRQIDMTLEEFKYICDYYQPSQRQKILNSLYNQGESIAGTKGLLQLKRECEAYLYKHSDIPIKHALDSINITIHLRQNGIAETKEINATTNKIWAYLEKQDTWYESDFRLLSTILYFFPLENIKQFTQKILNSIKKYKSFRYGNNVQIGLLVNLSTIYLYNGLKREEVEEAGLGDIIAVSGIVDANIGETIADAANPEALPFVEIDEPTLNMNFMVNDSPFAGKEGEFVTSRHLRDRLMKELETNVSLRVKEITPDCFEVSGRGELHLSVLIETMRREGFELQVSKPNVIFKEENGKKMEPMEYLTIDVPEEFMGAVMEKMGPRKAEMVNMTSAVNGYTRLEFSIPARGLIGFRNEFMTDTKGNGIMNHVFEGYAPYKGEIDSRSRGSIVSFEQGDAIAYGLFNAQERGRLFITPGTPVYQGMVVGECSRAEDLDINVCKGKKLTNTRASGSDDAVKLVPVTTLTLEQSIEFIGNDELVEVTPESIRIRKRYLDAAERKRMIRRSKK